MHTCWNRLPNKWQLNQCVTHPSEHQAVLSEPVHQSTRQYHQSLCIRAPGSTIRACASEHQAVPSEPVHQSTRQYHQSLCIRAPGSTIRACASEHQAVPSEPVHKSRRSTSQRPVVKCIPAGIACQINGSSTSALHIHQSTRQYYQSLCIRAPGSTIRACASEHQAALSEPVHQSTRQYHQSLCIRAPGSTIRACA